VIYGNEAPAREQGMTPEEWLRFHQSRSGPVMEQLRSWLQAQLEEKKVEPNSGLGSAMSGPVFGFAHERCANRTLASTSSL
jgi:transposase